MNEYVSKYQIIISGDASELLDELQALSGLIETTKCVPEVIQGIIDIFDRPEEIVSLDSDLDTTGAADHLIVRFKPSDRFAALMTSLWASKFEGVVV